MGTARYLAWRPALSSIYPRADQATLDYFMHDYVDHLEMHPG